MKILKISDTHFTWEPKHKYRLKLIEQIEQVLKAHEQSGDPIDEIWLLGDLADHKDNHGALLVNFLIEGFFRWLEYVHRIRIIRGNHDGIGETGFWKFTNLYDNIAYYDDIYETNIDGHDYLFLPHTRNPDETWSKVVVKDKVCIVHATVRNSVTESGFKLTEADLEAEYFAESLITFSGDIHQPQTVGKVIYVGSPYNTRFGDKFDGGYIIFDTKTLKWERHLLDFPRLRMVDVSDIKSLEKELATFKKGDHVKVRIHLSHEQDNLNEWKEIQTQATNKIVANFALENLEIIETKGVIKPLAVDQNQGPQQVSDFEAFCELNKINDRLKNVGIKLMQQRQLQEK